MTARDRTPTNPGRRPACAGAALALALLAFLTIGLHAGDALASCEGKVDHTDSDCLWARWLNKGAPYQSWYEVRNDCSEHGKVHVWLRRSGHNHHWHTLTGSNKVRRTNRSGYKVREVSCCPNTSDLCNESDITKQGCIDKYKKSSAFWTCTAGSLANNISVTDDKKCKIENMRCNKTATDSNPDPGIEHDVGITAKFGDFDDISNCDGHMKVGAC